MVLFFTTSIQHTHDNYSARRRSKNQDESVLLKCFLCQNKLCAWVISRNIVSMKVFWVRSPICLLLLLDELLLLSLCLNNCSNMWLFCTGTKLFGQVHAYSHRDRQRSNINFFFSLSRHVPCHPTKFFHVILKWKKSKKGWNVSWSCKEHNFVQTM